MDATKAFDRFATGSSRGLTTRQSSMTTECGTITVSRDSTDDGGTGGGGGDGGTGGGTDGGGIVAGLGLWQLGGGALLVLLALAAYAMRGDGDQMSRGSRGTAG